MLEISYIFKHKCFWQFNLVRLCLPVRYLYVFRFCVYDFSFDASVMLPLLSVNIFRYCNRKFDTSFICWTTSRMLYLSVFWKRTAACQTQNLTGLKLFAELCSFPQTSRASNITEFTISSKLFFWLIILKWYVLLQTETDGT